MAEIERTIADFVRIYHQALEPELPPAAGPRALLKARLAELSAQSPPSRWWRLRLQSIASEPAFALVLILLVALGIGAVYQSNYDSSDTKLYSESLPNPRLTPGLTRNVALPDLCVSDHDEVVRNVPVRLRERVFREYGIAGSPDADYEVDYLITPGLGGANDIRNLWPQPHYYTPWNSYVKDQLEDRLHHMVCSGEISLATAQHDLAHNWISAYQKYFHTDKPLPNYLASNATIAFHFVPKSRPRTLDGSSSLCRGLDFLLALGLALVPLVAYCYRGRPRFRDRGALRSFLSRTVSSRLLAFHCHECSHRSPGFQV